MAQLPTKVRKYLEANSKTWEAERHNMILQNDGSEDYIKSWNVTELAKPTDEQLDALESEANALEAENLIDLTRSNQYPTWQDQLDMQYHDLVDGTTTWQDAVQAVKDANPKP